MGIIGSDSRLFVLLTFRLASESLGRGPGRPGPGPAADNLERERYINESLRTGSLMIIEDVRGKIQVGINKRNDLK